jgi:pimeloyl-ACP methyl ester carboxylesterase
MGHGEVSRPPEEFSLERAAGHVQELLRWLQAGPAFLVGVFMGAAIAMRVVLSNPLLVRGLIPISPRSHTDECTASLVDHLFGLAEVGDMSTYTDLFLRYVLPSVYLERHSLEVERLRALAMEQTPQVLAYAWAACMASDRSDFLNTIHVPSLVIAGLYDLFTPSYLARAVPNGLFKVEF